MDNGMRLFKRTAGKRGRNRIIGPENSELVGLGYSRIILNGEMNRIPYENPGEETALICMKGEGRVTLGNFVFEMKPYDTLYLPPGKSGFVETDSALDILESSAPSDHDGEPVFVDFRELSADPELTENLGFEGCRRRIHRLIDQNVPARRLLCGLIFSEKGNWTSWPPHEHAATKEEIYIYFEMPPPSFGIQLVYDDLDNPEYLGPVREDDAVVIKRGYHPNVAVPGYPLNFVWIMATLEPSMKRSWEDVFTQPGFVNEER